MTKAERDREILALGIVHAVVEGLRGFGLIKDVPPAHIGQAIADAAQRIEPRLLRGDDQS